MTVTGAVAKIAQSVLFDAPWYLARYPHVAQAGQDPAMHYLLLGGQAGYDPGPQFSSSGYLATNPDVAKAAINPLLHYEEYGRSEGRSGFAPQTVPQPIDARFQAMLDGTAPGLGFQSFRQPMPRDNLADYTILTPTGDRAAAFNRCLDMIAGQSVQPLQWVIVDDGKVPLVEQIALPDWATYVRRAPHSHDPPHTLSSNIQAGLDHVSCDKVLIFEDDDWYAPLYAEYLLPFLDQYDLVGLNNVRYYLLRAAQFKTGTAPRHTAFAQSAFRSGHAWNHLLAVCKTNFPEVRERGVLDRYWWHSFEGEKHLLPDHPDLHLGLKGGFGRVGLAEGHQLTDPGYAQDDGSRYLRGALGVDFARYRRWQKAFRKPYVLYTTLAGGAAPPDVPDGVQSCCDLYAFSDRDLPTDCPWEAVPFDVFPDSAEARAQKPKIMPHLYFPDYDWSVWAEPDAVRTLDPGNLIKAAIESQTAMNDTPEKTNMPLVRRHNDRLVVGAMTKCWAAVLKRDEGP